MSTKECQSKAKVRILRKQTPYRRRETDKVLASSPDDKKVEGGETGEVRLYPSDLRREGDSYLSKQYEH
jgi:hypothetical protein